jgi:hypothetical protein
MQNSVSSQLSALPPILARPLTENPSLRRPRSDVKPPARRSTSARTDMLAPIGLRMRPSRTCMPA